jgi:uncharacterized membrane protein YfcA
MSDAAPAPKLRTWHVLLWTVAAFASTMCGIGGGLYAVPILHFLVGLPLKLAVSTSLVAVFALTLTGTFVELLQPSAALDWTVVILLSIGGFFGARVGHAFARRASVRTLQWIFAIGLTLAGVRILTLPSSHSALAIATDHHLTYVQDAWIAVIGFAGGFVAPLLGVGGGLVVVPALFLSAPGIQYLEARACSTAMSVVNAAQLTWMNVSAGTVHRSSALWFSAAAVIGASLGVVAVHLPGWADGARYLLGVTLLVIACRFALDLWRGPITTRNAESDEA